MLLISIKYKAWNDTFEIPWFLSGWRTAVLIFSKNANLFFVILCNVIQKFGVSIHFKCLIFYRCLLWPPRRHFIDLRLYTVYIYIYFLLLNTSMNKVYKCSFKYTLNVIKSKHLYFHFWIWNILFWTFEWQCLFRITIQTTHHNSV